MEPERADPSITVTLYPLARNLGVRRKPQQLHKGALNLVAWPHNPARRIMRLSRPQSRRLNCHRSTYLLIVISLLKVADGRQELCAGAYFVDGPDRKSDACQPFAGFLKSQIRARSENRFDKIDSLPLVLAFRIQAHDRGDDRMGFKVKRQLRFVGSCKKSHPTEDAPMCAHVG